MQISGVKATEKSNLDRMHSNMRTNQAVAEEDDSSVLSIPISFIRYITSEDGKDDGIPNICRKSLLQVFGSTKVCV